jgi:hypothetical protein
VTKLNRLSRPVIDTAPGQVPPRRVAPVASTRAGRLFHRRDAMAPMAHITAFLAQMQGRLIGWSESAA